MAPGLLSPRRNSVPEGSVAGTIAHSSLRCLAGHNWRNGGRLSLGRLWWRYIGLKTNDSHCSQCLRRVFNLSFNHIRYMSYKKKQESEGHKIPGMNPLVGAHCTPALGRAGMQFWTLDRDFGMSAPSPGMHAVIRI